MSECRRREAKYTESYSPFAGESTAGWDGFAFVRARASALCGRICGSMKWQRLVS